MAVYDEEKTQDNQYWGSGDGGASASDLKNKESDTAKNPATGSNAAESQENQSLGENLYSPGGKTTAGQWLSKKLNIKGLLKNKKKSAVIGLAIGAVGTGSTIGIMALFSFMNVFQLDHLLSNIDAKAFLRYQVDLDGRSKHWTQAYMKARLAEMATSRDGNGIDEVPGKDKNLLFRSGKVDTGSPFWDWYSSMRTSKFEKDLWDKQGIKFVSTSYYDPAIKGYRTRTATVSVKGQPDLNFDSGLADADLKNLNANKLNDFNGRLSNFIDVDVFGNDKAARKSISRAINENTRWYQVAKRFYLRKSIYNMTGTSNWRFFDKTRTKITDKKIDVRNRLILKIFKDNTRSGTIIQCVFAITDCSKMNTDPANPANQVNAPNPDKIDCDKNDKCNTIAETSDQDGNSNTIKNDQKLSADLSDSLSADNLDSIGKELEQDASKAGNLEKLVSTIISKELIKKLNITTSIVSAIDTLNKINESVKNKTLTKLVYMARAAQAIAVYTNLAIMRDQIKSGEIGDTQQVNDAMAIVAGGGNSAGFDAATNRNTSQAFAAPAFSEAKDKKDYCSESHQTEILKPENAAIAKSEYHWVCDDKKIGSTDTAKMIQDGWNSSVGLVLDPLLGFYSDSGINTLVGWFNGALDGFMQLTGLQKAVGDLVSGALKAVGLDDDFNGMIAWITDKVIALVGAGPPLKENSPGGQFVNQAAMGAAASAEFAARGNGAPLTTDETKQRSKQDVVAYLQNQSSEQSLYNRIANINNPESMLAKGMFAISNQGIRVTSLNTLSSLFSGSIFTRTYADDEDPYSLSSLAGLETYDYPSACKDSDPLQMTVSSMTNADELGVIPAEKLTWDMLRNASTFNAELYASGKSEDTLKQVYNCSLLDSVASGSLGGAYNSATLGGNAYGQ